MKHFMAVYTGSDKAWAASGWDKLSEQEQAQRHDQGMQAWGAWVEKHQHAIVDNGAPLGKTKSVTREGIRDITNNIAAYVVVKAESYDDAARMFVDHPHFTIFPGEGVEIMECLEIPGVNS